MNRIEVFSIKENQFTPVLIIGDDKDQSDIEHYDALKNFHLQVISDKHYFYCLKSSNVEEYGNIIEVYDKEGNIVHSFLLDKKVESIAIDDNIFLWGYKANIDNTILYKYKLM